jgi:hypothetical protein
MRDLVGSMSLIGTSLKKKLIKGFNHGKAVLFPSLVGSPSLILGCLILLSIPYAHIPSAQNNSKKDGCHQEKVFFSREAVTKKYHVINRGKVCNEKKNIWWAWY